MVVLTTNIFPGSSRPLARMRSTGIGKAPASDASTTRSSAVTTYRAGLSPLRSRTAATCRPSVNAIAAGPSHGSISAEWYS